MRIVDTICISKEKAVSHYVDLIVKIFEENSEVTQREGREFGCQLKKSKSGVCLDQNWMFVDRGEEEGRSPKFRFFLRT